jgi:3-phenylpropionate/trans-cinnamate dioxygenase ferredoxin reductase subunit
MWQEAAPVSIDGPVVLVGGGLAAVRAAETLRDEGFDGELTLIAAEDELPYERPPLSKGVLTGAEPRTVIFPHPDRLWFDERRIELRLGRTVSAIDPVAQTVTIDGTDQLAYRRLLLATGSSARRLPLPGADADNVFTLRTVADAERLRAALSAGDRNVVMVGAGWIGLEVASAAVGYGNRVTVIEPQAQPLLGALGPDLGAFFAGLHREHGVTLLLGTGVAGFDVGAGVGAGVTTVRTDAGETLAADLVVVGVGARPNVELAEAAGLTVDNGILATAALQTSDPYIYAAGDVANALNPFYGRPVRVEHWENAQSSGPAAAKAMLGQPVSYDHLPFFFSDQYDLGMEFTGLVDGADALVHRGDVAGREFIVFWTARGRVVAGMNVNVWDVSEQIGALIRSGAAVDPAALADPDVPLDGLV